MRDTFRDFVRGFQASANDSTALIEGLDGILQSTIRPTLTTRPYHIDQQAL